MDVVDWWWVHAACGCVALRFGVHWLGCNCKGGLEREVFRPEGGRSRLVGGSSSSSTTSSLEGGLPAAAGTLSGPWRGLFTECVQSPVKFAASGRTRGLPIPPMAKKDHKKKPFP